MFIQSILRKELNNKFILKRLICTNIFSYKKPILSNPRRCWLSLDTNEKSRPQILINKEVDNSKSSNPDNSFWRIKSLLLYLSCGMIILSVVLGGYTRRMRAGLSMTTWSFLYEKYPANNEEWVEEFERYKQIPEFKAADPDMTIEDFKQIFFLEYFHRLMARGTGIMVFIASAALCIRSPRVDKIRALIYSSFVILQGLLGWYMVKSGFSESTFSSPEHASVSQYRLAAHMALACFLLSLLGHRAMALKPYQFQNVIVSSAKLLKASRIMAHTALIGAFLGIISGGFVAGTHAGLIHNTWPSMSGQYVPNDMLTMQPTWRNFFENQTTVQFIHRNVAYFTAITTLITAGLLTSGIRKSHISIKASVALACLLIGLQITSGILTLLTCEKRTAGEHQASSLFLLLSLTHIALVLKRLKTGL